MERPQTAKPISSDIENLKNMIDGLNSSLYEKRSLIQTIDEKIEKFYLENKVKSKLLHFNIFRSKTKNFMRNYPKLKLYKQN